MTGRQNLEYFRRLKGIDDAGEIERVLEVVGLKNVKSPFKAYSLGMKQRLGMANAIMGNPEILILDEPVNGLDPQGISDIRNLIKHLNEEYGMTIIVSSHILGELQNTAHRFGIIHEGHVAKVVTEEELNHLSNAVRIKVEDAERAKEVLRAVSFAGYSERNICGQKSIMSQ